ncbi:MAG: hypothetical protein FWF84_02195, partial [Kiritimatiellaeota bacterium]|nr:hypothetical protein [Kiritimatiellota bacterium]
MKRMMVCVAALIAATGVYATGSWEQFHGTQGNNGRAATGPDLRIYDTPRFASAVDGMTAGYMSPNASGPVVMDGRVFCYGATGVVMAFSEVTGERL